MKFFRQMGKAFHSRVGAFVFYALAASAALFLHSAQWAYGWIAELYPLHERFVPTLFCVIGAAAAAGLGFFIAAAKLPGSRAARAAHSVVCVFSGVLFVYTTVLLFGLDKGFDPPSLRAGLLFLAPNLPFLGLALGLPFAFVLYPAIKQPARAALAILISLAVIIPVTSTNFIPKKKSFAISANPLVLDVGNGYYSIIFATNHKSTAELTYRSKTEEVTLKDAAFGRMNVSRIHHFMAPREQFNGSKYQFSAREVLSSVNANTEFGSTLQSDEFQFQGAYADSLNILIASDWHDQPENLLAAAANFPPPDLFLMLGDFASNYNSEDEFIRNTIAAGADATKSSVPVIYARGNHELYGEMTDQIYPNLGLEHFYYQVRRGKYLFTVCDGAEDWEDQRGSANEYETGSVNSEAGPYRDEQLAWLDTLAAPEAGTFHFSLIHIPNFDEGHADRQARFFGALNRLNADMQFSGHEHALHLDRPGEGEYQPPFPLMIDGGPEDGGYSGAYVCSMAQVSADGAVHLTAYNSLNKKLLDETLQIQ
ncbi:MAG: metallophosphoesterase [Oscillospiraceae bacterium]|jgi:hypothetical protein|nr:metallophosphoesterase [Oscillospiraceae bacterium]